MMTEEKEDEETPSGPMAPGPPVAEGAAEVLAIWRTEDRRIFLQSRTERLTPVQWGMALADAAHHLAASMDDLGVTNEDGPLSRKDLLALICEVFEEEIESSTAGYRPWLPDA